MSVHLIESFEEESLASQQLAWLDATIATVKQRGAPLTRVYAGFSRRILDNLRALQNQHIAEAGRKALSSDQLRPLATNLLFFKERSLAHEDVPQDMDIIYAKSLDFLSRIAPDFAQIVQDYQPRSAYQAAQDEITRNPLSLIFVDADDRRELMNVSYYANDRPSAFSDQLSYYYRIAQLNDPDALAFHRTAIPRIADAVYFRQKSVDAYDFICRILNAYIDVYGIKGSCEVNLVPDPAGSTNAWHKYHRDHDMHEFEFSNFESLKPEYQFAVVIHEATHMFQCERANPDFSMPWQSPAREIKPIYPKRQDAVMLTVHNEDVAPARKPVETNLDFARMIFGNQQGYINYRDEAIEREAWGAEAMALGDIYSKCGMYKEADDYKRRQYELLCIDEDPTRIDRSFDYQDCFRGMKMPQL